MRFILTIAFICLQITSIGQSNFSRQIDEIIRDTINGFKKLCGVYKISKDGSPYHLPKSPIEGTEDNRISPWGSPSWYFTTVINRTPQDSVATDSLLTVWINKLKSILIPQFTFEKASHPAGFKAHFIQGHKFRHGGLSLIICHWRDDPQNTTFNRVRLWFDYRKG